MTVSSGFFNSVNHDRLYDAEQLSSIFDGIIVDGVYENYGEALNVKAYPEANSTVIVGTGRAWFDHTWTLNDSQFSITIDPPNELLDRTDAIVIDVDKTQSIRKNSIIYVKGSESTPDLPPAFINTDLHKQYPLCYIARPAGSNKPVTQKDITITVGTSVCPIVTGVLEAQNLENLMQQLDDEFNTWWDGIKDTLDENTVTKLQNQINELKDKIEGDGALVGLLEKPIADAFMSGDYRLKTNSYNLSKNTSASVKFSSTDPNINQTINSWKPNVNVLINSYNPIITFLPDGKVAWIYFLMDNIGGYEGHTILQVCICDTNGVCTYTNKGFWNYGNGYNYDLLFHSDTSTFLADYTIDVYPVTFTLVLYTHYTRINPDAQACKVTITITSQGVVSINNANALDFDHPNAVTNAGRYYRYPEAVIPNESGNSIYPIVFHYDDGRLSYVLLKYSENGTLSVGDTVNTKNNFYTGSINNEKAVCETIDGKYIFGSSKDNYLVIDDSNLTLSVDSSSLSRDPIESITRYTANFYSLSEKNGVTRDSAILGSNNEFESVKDRPYFIGANNSSSAMPEGTYICVNKNERLYGAVSSGKQVAVGTNGGAAILNTSVSISSSLSKENTYKWLKGYINVGNSTKYLIVSNRNDSGGIMGGNQSVENPSVFSIVSGE